MNQYKMAVACENSNGEPDFFFCIVECSESDYEEGFHYDVANEEAEKAGYSPKLAYDEKDRGKAIMGLFEWKTASVFTIEEVNEK